MNDPVPTPQSVGDILLVIPDIPPTSGVYGLMVTTCEGQIHIYEGTTAPSLALSLDHDRAKQLHETLGKALETPRLVGDPLNDIPTPEETAALFAELKKTLKHSAPTIPHG